MEVDDLDFIESCQFSIGGSQYVAYPSGNVSIGFLNE
jgi:hypothetical protein